MSGITMVSVGLELAAVLSLVVIVEVQHAHGHPAIKDVAPPDKQQNERVALGLSQADEAGMKRTMREHLEALQAIVASLGRQEFEQATRVAHEELGFSKHHQAMQREAGATFPPRYHELAMAHHQAAEDLAEVIRSRDIKQILVQLDRTMKACTVCHQAFRL